MKYNKITSRKNILLHVLLIVMSPVAWAGGLSPNMGQLDQTMQSADQSLTECANLVSSHPVEDGPIIVEDDNQIPPNNREAQALEIAKRCGDSQEAKAHKAQWLGGGWWGSFCSAGCLNYGWVGQSCACTYMQTVCNWWGVCQFVPVVQWGFIMY